MIGWNEILTEAHKAANVNNAPIYVFETVHGYAMDDYEPIEDVNGSAILNGVLEILPEATQGNQ